MALIAAFAALPATSAPSTTPAQGSATVTGCRVVDGDTIRCGREAVRLLGIDAPEMPGHCRTGRICVTGDPYAARASLARVLLPVMAIERVGYDRYGRTLALADGARGDLSCWQLARGQAVYKPQWDNDGRVAQRCPDAAERQSR